MNLKQELNLQLFADAGTLVNASGNYVNAYSGETSAFPDGGGMTASMKTFYDTELLENARANLVHSQFRSSSTRSLHASRRCLPDAARPWNGASGTRLRTRAR